MKSFARKSSLNASLGLVAASAFVMLLGVSSAFALMPPTSSPTSQGVARTPSSHALILAQATQGAESNGVEEEKKGIEEEHQGVEEERHGMEEEREGVKHEEMGIQEEQSGVREEEKGMQEQQKEEEQK